MAVAFEHRTLISAPLEAVFDLSLDIDAHTASMGPSGERAVAGVTSGHIGLNEQVTWRATHFGIPFRMTSKVTELERPHRSVDEQVAGPFRRWHHEHRFDTEDGSTVMVDEVHFEAPLGPIGRVVEHLVLATYMRKLIAQRAEFLRTAAEAAGND